MKHGSSVFTIITIAILLCPLAVSGQIVAPIGWTYSAGYWYFSYTTIDSVGNIHAFGCQATDAQNERASKFNADTGELLGSQSYYAFYTSGGNGGLDRDGNPYMVFFEDDWDGFIGLKIIRVVNDYAGMELFSSHSLAYDAYSVLWPLGKIRQSSTGNLVTCGTVYYYFGGGFELMKEHIYIVNPSGYDVTFRSYSIGMPNRTVDWELAYDDEIYTLVTYMDDDWESENTLRKATYDGNPAWELEVADNDTSHALGVMAKPAPLGGGAFVFGYHDNGDGFLVSVDDLGEILGEVIVAGIPLYDGCLTFTNDIAACGENALVFLSLDGSVLHAAEDDRFGVRRTSITRLLDGGFVISGGTPNLDDLVRVNSIQAQVDIDPELVPSGGGRVSTQLECRTAMIYDTPGVARLLVAHQQTGDVAIERELDLMLTPLDTLTFALDDSIDGALPDGTYDVVLTLTSVDSIIRAEARSTLQKGETGVDREVGARNPASFSLRPVYPNPFNSTVTVSFDLNRPTPVNLTVFDLLGREVTVLGDHMPYPPGTHRVVWDASGLPGGTYFLRAQTEDEQQVRRMLFLK